MMEMTDEKICDACGSPFEWLGTVEDGVEFCCKACSRGEACECLTHNHPWTERPLRFSDVDSRYSPTQSRR